MSAPVLALAFLVIVPAALLLVLSVLAWFLLAWRKPRRPSRIRAQSLARGSLTREQLGRPWETHGIRSTHGYDLVVHVLAGARARIALFHHGVRWNWMGSIKYAEAFVREGWTVIAFDSRGHGETGGARPSFGHFERDDLLTIADWALARWPSDGGFVVHGESLGGASALQYAPLDPRLDAVIADCPFSSAREILETRLRALPVPRQLIAPVVHLAAILIRATEHWRIDDASPRRSILRTSLPILLIHGSADTYVPTAMSVSMAAERRRLLPDAVTELRLVEGARHAAAFRADPVAYEAAVLAFVEAALSRRFSMPASLASTVSLD